MNYYVLEGSFLDGHPEGEKLQKQVDAHLKYLQAGFDDGSILLSGPKVGQGGGVIVIKCDDIQKFCSEDPFVKAGIQEYRITEFKMHGCEDAIKNWFDD